MADTLNPWAGKTGRADASAGRATVDNESVPVLFQPFKLRDLQLKNRIVVSPMCQYSAHDGFFSDYHLMHLGAFARGGAALVIAEATGVSPEGRITPHCTGLWKDEHIAPLRRIVKLIHSFGSAAGIQLAHAGRKASTAPPFFRLGRQTLSAEEGGWPDDVVAPSPIAYRGLNTPKELTRGHIKDLIQKFADATRRADEAGFDVVEIHGAHGYLISSFNSALSNHRTDEYGGSFENRTRFAVEIARAVRAAFPQHKPVIYRSTSSDWADGGWTSAENVKLAALLKEAGVDLIDCSSGGNSPDQKVEVRPGYQVQFSEDIKHELPELPTGTVGLITEPHHANEILESGKADFIFLARQFLRDPHWPLTAAKALGVDVEYPMQLDWCVRPPKKAVIKSIP